MDGADVTRGCDEAIQEQERADDLSETLRHWCRSVPKTLRHRHKKVRHFGTKDIVPNCLKSEVSWVQSVRTPRTEQLRVG